MKATIIGAGIAGLSLALCLEKQGLDYELFEAAEDLKALGAGIVLSPNVLYIFDQLGIKEEIESSGAVLSEFQIVSSQRKSLQRITNETQLHGKSYCAVGIHRAVLQEILLSKLQARKLYLGYKLARLEPSPLSLEFANGITIQPDCVVGADGIHSQVRQSLEERGQLRYSGQSCWRGLCQLEAADLPEHVALEFWGNGDRFGIVPIDKGQLYWYAPALCPAGQKDASSQRAKANLLELYQDYHPMIKRVLEATPDAAIMRHDLHDLTPLSRWHNQTTVLIGDAAHATTPNLGQGAAQGIEDAWVLSHKLKNAASLEQAFTEFETQRRPKAKQVVQLSWQIGQLANLKNPLLTMLRNQAFRLSPKSWTIKQRKRLYFVPASAELIQNA
ncbi:MAG: FAD-dependent monooxygenase [Trueperaceae bacterium]|nr:FAD-dependent monooxygenase [Trueperaceae bacterium]